MSQEILRESEERIGLMQILGPLFLICTLMLAGKIGAVFNYDLLAIALLGLFFSAKWKMRGCIYALVLLGISALVKHLWISDHHAFQALLEGSVVFSLLISALNFEENSSFFAAVSEEKEKQGQTLQYLEEDIVRLKEESFQEKVDFANKMSALQSQYEEIQIELSSLQILNEVLRKSTALAIEEKNILTQNNLESNRRLTQILDEIDSLQQELSRLGNESMLVEHNKQLLQELNAARVQEEQTHLVNETLVYLHAKENQRAQGLALEQEKTIAELHSNRRELEIAPNDIEQISQKMHALVAEKNHVLEQLQFFRSRVEELTAIDLLYRQLKAQFEEKNQILHQTRVELFHSDTEVQTLKQEMQQKELEKNVLPEGIREELDAANTETIFLEEENQLLQEVITQLMQPNELDASKTVKKKMKKIPSLSFEQGCLF